MHKTTAGLLGAVAGLASMGVAHAAIPVAPPASTPPQAASYADLLTPVVNAMDALRADDAARMQQKSEPEGRIQLADYDPHHHHHHHHHQAYNRHHHHHHHHHSTVVGIPGLGVVVGHN